MAVPPLLQGPGPSHQYNTFTFGGDDRLNNSLQNNINARMQIVNSLGGEEFVRKIPAVEYPLKAPSSYMDGLADLIQFPDGCNIVQTLDPTYRKALALRITQKGWWNVLSDIPSVFGAPQTATEVVTVFQRYVETCVTPMQSGDQWRVKQKGYPEMSMLQTDGACELLKTLLDGTHPQYKLA